MKNTFIPYPVKIIVFIVFIMSILPLSSRGQAPENLVTIKFAGIQYKVPSSWEHDGFGSWKPGEWNEHGSAVCECTGFIHIDYEKELYMVFYPSLPEYIESERHNMIWDYKYLETDEAVTVKVGKIEFEKEVSVFDNADKYVVWRYKFQQKKYGYLVYFFGSPEIMANSPEGIGKIMESFKRSGRYKLKIK